MKLPSLFFKLITVLAIVSLSACGGGGSAGQQQNPQEFTVSVTVNGLDSGKQVTLQNNAGNATTVSANGSFTFRIPVAYNGSYAVTVGTQPVGQTCTVSNGSGSGVVANVNNIIVSCSNVTYTVSGSVTGLGSGTQVTLQNNAGNATTVSANGSFTFSTPVAYNGSYAVTVGTQPTGQTCTVSNGSGSGVVANVGNVTVTCSPTCATTLTGILAANTQYSSSGSPYCISNSLQIPAGITATFDAGTTIRGGSIVVQGGLNINGVIQSKVNIENVQIVPAGLLNGLHDINVAYAVLTGGSIYNATGNAIYGSLKLTDSVISGASYIYLWYPVGVNIIERNKFISTGGISFGLNFNDSGAPLQSLTVRNNYFSTWTTQYALQNWAQYGTGSVVIEKNTFAVTSGYAAVLPSGYSASSMNLANNYWGTANVSTINSYIYDKNDDVTSGGFINYLPILSNPDQNTPIN